MFSTLAALSKAGGQSLSLPILMWDTSVHQPIGAARRGDRSDPSDLVYDSTLWSQEPPLASGRLGNGAFPQEK